MASFKYKVKDKTGRTLEGMETGEDERSLVARLQGMGYYIIAVEEVRERAEQGLAPQRLFVRWFINPIFAGAAIKDLAVFYHQLSTMVKSGMTLAQAMSVLRTQGGSRRLRKIAEETVEHLQAGGLLSDAFARYPWMFSELQICLIRAGESGGLMDNILERIADYLDREHAVRQRLRLSTLYPKILILAVIFIPAVPKLVLEGFGAYARATLGVLVPVLAILLAIWAVYRVLYQVPEFRYTIDCVKIAFPKLGNAVRKLALSKFYRVLGAMIGAGVPLSQALTHAADACGNWYLGSRLRSAVPEVEQGTSFTESLKQTQVLPPMALNMIATGEQTGNVDEMLSKTAEYTENEAELTVLQNTLILGVLLLLCVAAYIGWFVVRFWIGFYQGVAGG